MFTSERYSALILVCSTLYDLNCDRCEVNIAYYLVIKYLKKSYKLYKWHVITKDRNIFGITVKYSSFKLKRDRLFRISLLLLY